MNVISANLNLMIKAGEKASKALIRDFGEVENLQVSAKGPSDFVTNADTHAEKIIINELLKSKKNYSILSEEAGFIKNKDEKNIWIVDPIDGTSNFLHGIPHFAISIALKSDNEIVSGIILDPIKNEMFFAEKGQGAYLNNQRIRVSNKSDFKNSLLVTGGPRYTSKVRDKTFKEYIELANKVRPPIRKSGSAALDLAYVAAGRFDGSWQRELNYWDIAAGIIIIKESGGYIENLAGETMNEGKIDLVATNSKIHKDLRNFL